ncbi:uncharacterized protein LOC131621540 [Vicia villosa]|uniref:uncharacterized protein LOC131621540 n=1 Tax=Vicia villosa TaxID=3911 RepID=UPI00273B91EC|nr:uncharacterized protein LOC131621540 [Vicia villosa]
MKIISLNCRGLGSPRAVRALLRLIRLENPSVVFLMETRLKKEELLGIQFKCGYEGCFAVDCEGSSRDRAGGLGLLWMNSVNLTITSFSLNFIGSSVRDDLEEQPWELSGVYGYPEENNKKKTWLLVQKLVQGEGRKTLMVGDFNDILAADEKIGGIARSLIQLSWSRQSFELCGLIDLGFEGYPYTWSNGRKFGPIWVIHLSRFGSYHAAIRIDLEAAVKDVKRKRVHIFRFEEEYRVGNLGKEIRRLESLLEEDRNWSADSEGVRRFKELEKQKTQSLTDGGDNLEAKE